MKDFEKDYKDAVGKALKILGKGAEFTAPVVDPVDAAEDAKKALGEVNKARIALMKQVDNYENALDKIKNATKQYNNTLAKDKFGLDESKPDDKKKIAEARKLLTKVMDSAGQQCDDSLKALANLDRAISPDVE